MLFTVFFVSLAARMACSLCAFLTSGFWLRLARMSESMAPTTARWNFCVFFVRFLEVSSSMPLRCFLQSRYRDDQISLQLRLCQLSHETIDPKNQNYCETPTVIAKA